MARERKAPEPPPPPVEEGRLQPYQPPWQRQREREAAEAAASAARAARSLPESVSAEYRRFLPIFEDFLQARSFAKLVKLAKDKSNLPIAAYADDIVEALRHNQAVVLAGDTGCGKSTQARRSKKDCGWRLCSASRCCGSMARRC